MQFQGLSLAVLLPLLSLSFESAFAATQTVTKCTATATNLVTLIGTVTKTTTAPAKTITSVKTTVKTVTTAQTTITKTKAICMPTHVNVLPNGGFEYKLNSWNPLIGDPKVGNLTARCDGDPAWVKSGDCAVSALFSGPDLNAAKKPTRITRAVTFCKETRYNIRYQEKITGSCSLALQIDDVKVPAQGNTGSPAEWRGFAGTIDVGKADGLTITANVSFDFRGGSVGACGISLDDVRFEATGPIPAGTGQAKFRLGQ